MGNSSVSEWTMRTRSSGTPKLSATMAATTVSPPVPFSGSEVVAVMEPSGFTLIDDEARPAPWPRSAIPTP